LEITLKICAGKIVEKLVENLAFSEEKMRFWYRKLQILTKNPWKNQLKKYAHLIP